MDLGTEAMARSDLLINLVRSSSTGNRQLVRSTVEAIIAEERAKQHHVLADRLAAALASVNGSNGTNGNGHHTYTDSAPKVRDYFVEKKPERTINELMLNSDTRKILMEFIEEHQRADILRSFGLEPRNKTILIGPPGNGKTTLAESVAEALSLPFYVVRYDAVIGSYLGETASRLRKIFDYLRTFACVVFFDEFDVVGKERGDENETGEIKRVVSSLLMQMDDLPSYTIVFAASNHPELLDRGIWRRFDLKLSLPNPSQSELETFLSQLSRRATFDLPISTEEICKRIGKLSYAEMERFFLSLRRRVVLSGQEKLSRKVLDEQIITFKHMRDTATPSNKRI